MATDLSHSPISNPPVESGERVLRWIERIAVFALGFALMNYFYAASVAQPGQEIGLPGHDSFYHVTMASMLPEHGLLAKFPWLQYTYFRDQGDDFVSHHWGFHLLLLPFVKAGEWLKDDALAGGRWAISAVFGANLLLFHLLLRQRRVPLHWLWIALFLLLPDQFFARHGYVRAIGASLLFMQLILLALFARRYWLGALAIAGYVHLYLGAVFYGPVIVALYAAALVIAPREGREIPWKMVLLLAGGWAVGVCTYPYSSGMFEFLKLQVFGSGLSPDIEVGAEWRPYTDAWYLVKIAAPLLTVWVAALVLRLRVGPRLDARETMLVVLQFVFLLLTIKARRFIEYWPPICLLSAAYLAAPPLRQMAASTRAWLASRGDAFRAGVEGALIVALGAACLGTWAWIDASAELAAVFVEWRVWAAFALLLVLPPIVRTWAAAAPANRTVPLGRVVAILLGGALLILGFGAAVWTEYGDALAAARTKIPGFAWGLIVIAYGLAPLLALRPAAALRPRVAAARTLTIVLLGILVPSLTLASASGGFASAARQLKCFYDLGETRALMSSLKELSQPGDVVFTDDWDTFPLFFHHNRHNHYIVGLDPKFTHQREPDLWSRYVKISRGEIPSTIRLTSAADGNTQATVDLEDIRDHFHARFVIADRDHRRLADALARAPELAEFVYPGDSYERARHAEYVVFRIRDRHESAAFASAGASERRGPVYLSDERPLSASQGWGDLGADRSVDGNRIRLGGKTYVRGLGTHAPARLLYTVPEGYAWFEAVVGIDDETEGRGSTIASIQLDGRTVYESPQLLGGADAVVVRIPLSGARQIQLQADTTPDGQQFDHVAWAEARFVPAEVDATPPAKRVATTASDSLSESR